jgi:hypothetical protein
MPEEYESWVDAQIFSEKASNLIANFKDVLISLDRTRKKTVLDNIWNQMNAVGLFFSQGLSLIYHVSLCRIIFQSLGRTWIHYGTLRRHSIMLPSGLPMQCPVSARNQTLMLLGKRLPSSRRATKNPD